MINITDNQIVYLKTGKELDKSIREQLRATALTILDIYGLSESIIDKVSTKTGRQVLYSKLVLELLLENPDVVFNDCYLDNAYKLYQWGNDDDSKKDLLYKFLGCNENQFEFKKQYKKEIRRGIGPLLVALHSAKVITLPWSFSWPSLIKISDKDQNRVDIGKPFSSELLGFIRSLDTKLPGPVPPAFDVVGTDVRRREWFSGYATKVILALGWHSPEDVNLEQLLEFRNIVESRVSAKMPYSLILEVLCREYGNAISVTQQMYKDSLKQFNRQLKYRAAGQKQEDWAKSSKSSDSPIQSLRYGVETLEASDGYPEKFESANSIIEGLVDFDANMRVWLIIENAYLDNLRKESNKQVRGAIGWLNIYLFFYLPRWFLAHPKSNLDFPDCPRKLHGGVYVSRLIKIEGDAPDTLMVMMNSLQKARNWKGNSYYAILKQLQLFFEFVERKSNSLPDCEGFRQPLTGEDFPVTTRSHGSNKRPIEKRLFGVALSLTEALITYSEVITERILSGALDCRQFQSEVTRFGRVIDTFQVAHLVGFVPILFFRGKLIPLRIIPNCLSFTERHKLKQHDIGVQIPSPHALNQIFVALHTGLRHNHIQWLDERTFDNWAIDDESTFTQLYVNTDKSKNEAWSPYVCSIVIERLRAQRRWRNLFDEPGFAVEHFYNNNAKTKWNKIIPLFSFARSGLPHTDIVYSRVWSLLLSTLQGLLRDLGEESTLPFKFYGKSIPRIGMLEPSNVEYNDPNADEKRKLAGVKKYIANRNSELTHVPLEFKSPRTPHSTRLSVVQQYMSYLPAEYIGKYLTGQTARTVNYYYVPDASDLEREGVHQAMVLRNSSNSGFDDLVKHGANRELLVRADDERSSLSLGLIENLTATLEAHGCVSLSLANSDASGVEVLRRTMAVDAVLNKTEICPYGNKCPPEVIKLLGKPTRCGLCPYAVRSVDHLPAVSAKVKQQLEILIDLQSKIDESNLDVLQRYTDVEFEQLEKLCSEISEDITGWQLSEEVLYHTLQRLRAGVDTGRWVVQLPEVVVRDLTRVALPSNVTSYTLARLHECIAFPTLESPQIRARFELMRRQLLARTGRVNEALSINVSNNPATECAGLLRTIVESYQIGHDEIVRVLQSEDFLLSLPSRSTPMLTGEM